MVVAEERFVVRIALFFFYSTVFYFFVWNVNLWCRIVTCSTAVDLVALVLLLRSLTRLSAVFVCRCGCRGFVGCLIVVVLSFVVVSVFGFFGVVFVRQ